LGEVGLLELDRVPGVDGEALEHGALVVHQLCVDVGDEVVEGIVTAVEPIGRRLGDEHGAELDDVYLVLFDLAGVGEPLDDLPRVLKSRDASIQPVEPIGDVVVDAGGDCGISHDDADLSILIDVEDDASLLGDVHPAIIHDGV
jgi:hypothetical protein